MKDIKWTFVFFAIAAVITMCGIGISIGANSIPGAILSVLALLIVMGFGFKTKSKMRKQGLL
ncbi:YlaF family protein [Sporosarcina siberiensis]|uniref:YlaF family protein n=1 Tax=Sporosarcina siberiensis TaxID=1365606 RepID=A0ABW4SKP7_9BACL